MSQRQLIRKVIKDLLKGATDAGEQVFTSRSIPTWVENLPVILIYTKDENVERFNEAPKSYRRILNLELEIVAKGSEDEDVQEVLDRVSDQIESLMEKDETLGNDENKNNIANKLELSKVEYTLEADGDSPVGMAKNTYSIEYFTDVVFDCFPDFKQANIDYQVGHHDESPDDVIDAQDQVDVPIV